MLVHHGIDGRSKKCTPAGEEEEEVVLGRGEEWKLAEILSTLADGYVIYPMYLRTYS
jgi:hypothetical protein